MNTLGLRWDETNFCFISQTSFADEKRKKKIIKRVVTVTDFPSQILSFQPSTVLKGESKQVVSVERVMNPLQTEAF